MTSSTELEANGQVAFRYAAGAQPERQRPRHRRGASTRRGNVLGLMPHPEHAVDPLTGSDDGLALFRALVGAAPRPTAA